MLRQCHSLNRLLQEWGCSCHDRSQPGPSRHLLSTATWTLQSRLDMHSFSCVTIRAREGALLFRIGEIFHCHSGGCSQSLVRDTVKIPVSMQCVFPNREEFHRIWTWHRRLVPNQFTPRGRMGRCAGLHQRGGAIRRGRARNIHHSLGAHLRSG